MSTPTSGRLGLKARIPEQLVSNEKVVFAEAFLVLILVWSVLANGLNMTDTISSPMLVGVSLYELLSDGEWLIHVRTTLQRSLYGFVVTMVVGTFLGVLMGMSDFWRDALKDFVTIGLALPSLFAVVFVAMWYAPSGLVTELTPTVAAMTIGFPFVTQNVYQGIRGIDMDLVDMSNSFDVSRREMIRHVLLPSVMPEWFSGVRYAFAIAWKITTLAELIVAEVGVGFMIQEGMRTLSLTSVITWTVLFLIVILIVEYGILQQIEKRLFAWRQSEGIAWA